MEQSIIKQEMAQLILIIQDWNIKIQQYTGSAPAIELDLMMQKVAALYDRVNQLRSLPIPTSVDAVQKVNEQKVDIYKGELINALSHINLDQKENKKVVETLTEEEIVKEVVAPAPVAVTADAKRIEVFKEQHALPQEEKLVIQEQTVIERQESAKRKVRSTAELFDETTTYAETFSIKTTTLNDKMTSGKTERSMAVHHQSKSLTDLKKSIGINERFLFVKELFAENQQVYNQSIDKLNNFSNYEEARQHLFEELATKMYWDTSSKVFGALSELVRRRFIIE